MNIQEVHGSDYEIGRQRGHRNAEHIRSMIRRYVRSEMTPEYLVLRTKLLSSVEKRFPDGFAEMQGIADGSDIPLERICDLNLYPSVSWLTGCTSFAFRSSDRGPLMGKTGDCGLEQRENYLLLFPMAADTFLLVVLASYMGERMRVDIEVQLPADSAPGEVIELLADKPQKSRLDSGPLTVEAVRFGVRDAVKVLLIPTR